jgi:hypothetical protein
MCNLIGVTNSKVYITGFPSQNMTNREDNEDVQQARFVRAMRRAELFEDLIGKAEQEALRRFAGNPLEAYLYFFSTRAELGEIASRVRGRLKEETYAAANELLSYSNVTPEMLRAALAQQNLEYARENGLLGGKDLQ